MKIQLYIEGISEEAIRELKKAKFELVVKKRNKDSGQDDANGGGNFGAVKYVFNRSDTKKGRRPSGAGNAHFCVRIIPKTKISIKRAQERKNILEQRCKHNDKKFM